jgi:hypothetical protein
MKNYRTLSSQAEAEIEALRYKGVTLSDSDIIAINALAWEIETPSKRVSLARGKPCKCGNVWFWPLTIHSGTWWDECGCEMKNSEHALAYAMAHRDADLYTVTEEQIESWFKTIRATIQEVRHCLTIIIDQCKRDDLPVKEDNSITLAQLAQLMVDNHGGTFEMWERQCSIDYVRNFIDTTCKQDEAEQKKTRIEKATLILARYTQSLLRKHNGK